MYTKCESKIAENPGAMGKISDSRFVYNGKRQTFPKDFLENLKSCGEFISLKASFCKVDFKVDFRRFCADGVRSIKLKKKSFKRQFEA